MKVSIARIRLYLKEGKTLSDGSHPIMLMCSFNGRKEVSTSYSCVPKYWDKKSECVKKGYPNFVAINHAIQQLKNEAIERRNEFERLREPYTPQMILSPKKSLSAVRSDLKGLIEDYIKEKAVKEKTAYNWKYLFNLISEFDNDGVIITEIKIDYVKRFIKWMQSEKKLSEGSIKVILSNLASIVNYAISKGLMTAESHPFNDWKYTSKFKTASRLEYIHWKTLDVMKSMLLDDIIVQDGDLWHYKDGILDELLDRKSALFARFLYMEMVLFQGMAQVDLCHIRKEDIQVKTINGKDYYYWDGKRYKTYVSVKVMIPCHTTYTEVMVKTMMMFNEGEWLLPVLNGLTMETSEEKRKHRISGIYNALSPKLKEWFRAVNKEVVRRNVEDGSDIPLIDATKCTYYSARHSYSQMYIAKGGNILGLATFLGRSIDTISTYVRQLSEEKDLVDAIVE